MSQKILFFLLACFLAVNVFAQTANDNAAVARAFVDTLTKKNFAKAYSYLGDEVKSKISSNAMSRIWAQVTGEYGQFQKPGEVIKSADNKGFVVINEFEKATVAFMIFFDEKGKIKTFALDETNTKLKNAPKYEAPVYATLNSFTEKEVAVGVGTEWILPATLTLPNAKGNVPAVVLVHGSGPNDRDETHENPVNKPFKDLAWGLASRGIAVLRYEKRSKQYPGKLSGIKNVTVKEETIDDALAAVELLRQTGGIEPNKIYVLRHSLGGYLLPRIAARDEKIAGLISFAGATRPLEDAILEQETFFATLDGTISKEEQTELDETKQLVAKIKSLKESDKNSAETFYGAPASYFLDLKNYNPPQEAKSVKQPFLILQGERDYQVTMTDFQNWKNALGGSKTATFLVYPTLNHLFMPGEGAPSPGDYEKTNHVLPDVVSDIAAWVLRQK